MSEQSRDDVAKYINELKRIKEWCESKRNIDDTYGIALGYLLRTVNSKIEGMVD